MAQAIHGAVQFVLDNLDGVWRNDTLVVCGLKDENSLKFWKYKLEQKGHDVSSFYEPDLDNQLTSLSVLAPEDTKDFKNLQIIQ